MVKSLIFIHVWLKSWYSQLPKVHNKIPCPALPLQAGLLHVFFPGAQSPLRSPLLKYLKAVRGQDAEASEKIADHALGPLGLSTMTKKRDDFNYGRWFKSWLVVWIIFYFSIYWEFHHPNWRTPWFFRGDENTNQRGLTPPKNHHGRINHEGLSSSDLSWLFLNQWHGQWSHAGGLDHPGNNCMLLLGPIFDFGSD